MKEIQLIINPPKEPCFRRNLKSSVQPHLAHYIFPTGENKTVQKPHDVEIDTIHIQLFGEKGEEFIYELKLPFLIVGLKGTTALVSSAHLERRLKKFNTKLEDYISKLFKNPSINSDFFDFIKNNNINLSDKRHDRENRKIVSRRINTSLLEETGKITIFFEDEALTKFFFKIAWTYAVKVLGREKLINPLSEWIFNYITSGHINDIFLVQMYPDLFLNPSKVGNDEYIFWKYDIKKTSEIIRDVVLKDDLSRIMKHYNYRYEGYGNACNLIRISNIELLDDEIRKNADHYRYHELSLKAGTENWIDVTICVIKLYGGILKAEVLLVEELMSNNFPPSLKFDI
jgi:hypothetical protein